MPFETPRLCRNCGIPIYFRRNPDGRIIPYNADSSGGHNCGHSANASDSEYQPHPFRPAFEKFPTPGQCSNCGHKVQVIPVAWDPLLSGLQSFKPFAEIYLDKTEWPWSLHLCPPDYTKAWDGHASLVKEACVDKDIIAELTLVISTVRVHCVRIWKAAIQTVKGQKKIGYFDNRLVSGQLTASYQGDDGIELLTVACQTVETAQWIEEADDLNLGLPDGWLKS